MALQKACTVKTNARNTGKECDTSLLATAMLIAIDKSVKFTKTDFADPVAWLNLLIHQRKAFPMFGTNAPIRTITNGNESDVIITMDDGFKVFLQYGIYNRTFRTTSGGLCYAQSLASLNKSGYNLLEIDKSGQMLARQNSDGTFSGFVCDFMYAESPNLADFKSNPYTNGFNVSYRPEEIVNNGIIFTGASALLSMMGLIDVKITDAGGHSITKIKVNVLTSCAEADMLALFPSALPVVGNFVITNATTGAVVTPTAAAIVSGILEFTGTFASGQKFIVSGAAPTVWNTALVSGYDASQSYSSVTVSIP